MGRLTKLLTIPALAFSILVFASKVIATTSSYTASDFSKFCAKNPEICNKEEYKEASSASVSCPLGQSQIIDKIFVHAGDGKTVYELPHSGFSYDLEDAGSMVVVTLSGHKHKISWVGVTCHPKPAVTPTSTPVPTPSPTETPLPSPTETPSPTPTEAPLPTPTPTPSPTPTEVARGGLSEAGAPVCSDPVPPTPTILSLTRIDNDSFRLVWSKVTPATSYSIIYGPAGNLIYSVFDTGDTDNFVINGISQGCFAVKSVNGCMPGGYSSQVCSGGQGAVLGASTLGATGSLDFSKVLYSIGFLLTAMGLRRERFSKKIQK